MAKYDYYHPVRFLKDEANIYHCPICGKSLEIKAYRMLEKKAEELNSMHYENLIQNVLSLNIECCGQDYIAFFHKKAGELIKDFFLIEIKNSIIKIEGLYTRNECQIIFEKLTRRWNVLYNFTIIGTPFVGYENLKDEDFLLLGNWLLECVDTRRTTIVTRKTTLKRFDQAFSKDATISRLIKEGCFTSIFNDSKKYSHDDFHAKFYIGYSAQDEKVEVLEGSWNIGPASESYENLQFKTYSIEEYIRLYLKKHGALIYPLRGYYFSCIYINSSLIQNVISYDSEGVNIIKNNFTIL